MYNYEIGAEWSEIQKADGVFRRLRLSGDDGIGRRRDPPLTLPKGGH